MVKLYIERLRAVNKIVNAVVDDRYNDAIQDAKKADEMCETMTPIYLLQNYPLLGVPFTVKESVGVKGEELCPGLKVIRMRSLSASRQLIKTYHFIVFNNVFFPRFVTHCWIIGPRERKVR